MARNDGTKAYFRGEKKVDITWGDKISEGLKAYHQNNKTEKLCKACGETFIGTPNAKWCSDECSYRANYTDADPLLKRASVAGANLLMGKGKKAWLIEFFKKAIDKPCRYCRQIITLENLSVDHIEAYGESKSRRNKKENKHIRLYMDRKENLQVICRACNSAKGDFSHIEYQALLDLDLKFPGIRDKLHKRLRMGALAWSKRPKRPKNV